MGTEIATTDPVEYFVPPTAWDDLMHDRIDLVLGRKGTGKTKMYRNLQARSTTYSRGRGQQSVEHKTYIVPLISQLDDDFREMLKVAGNDEELMKTGWLLQVGLMASQIVLGPVIRGELLADTKDTAALKSLQQLFRNSEIKSKVRDFILAQDLEPKKRTWGVVKSAMNRVSKFRVVPGITTDGVSVTGTIVAYSKGEETEDETAFTSLRENARQIIRSLMEILDERGIRLWVLVDSIDELLYGIGDEHATSAVRSLLRAVVDLRQMSQLPQFENSTSTLRLKVFAREDVFDRITRVGPFPGLNNIPAARIKWTTRQVALLIAERVLASGKARAFYGGIQVRDVSEGEYGPEEFVSRVLTGAVNRGAFRSLVDQTADSSGSVSPRNLVQCVKTAFDMSIAEGHLGEKYATTNALVSEANLDNAKNAVSAARLDDTVIAEYPFLGGLVERLHGAPHTYMSTQLMSAQLELELEVLENYLYWADLAGLTFREGRQIKVANVYRRVLRSTTSAVTEVVPENE